VKSLSSGGLVTLIALGLASPVLAQDEAAAPESSVTQSSAQPPQGTYRPNVHLGTSGVLDVVARRAGVELSATYDVTRYADLGLGVSLGESIGILLLAQFHFGLPSETLVRPFVQVRGEFHITSRGYGGGMWAGVELELGNGRFKAGPALLAFAPRSGYHSYAVLGVAGFELDLPSPIEASR
jgi:hypothetical protein